MLTRQQVSSFMGDTHVLRTLQSRRHFTEYLKKWSNTSVSHNLSSAFELPSRNLAAFGVRTVRGDRVDLLG